MTLEEDRVQLIAQARLALRIGPADVDAAAQRFQAGLEIDAQRGGWQGSMEVLPMVRTWGRVLVFGALGVALIVTTMSRCPLNEEAIAPPDVDAADG